MAYGNNKMNTQAPMPMRPGIGTLPKAGGMSPMNTGGMPPMNIRGGTPMQSGLLQGLAAQGQGNDTELAHVTPAEGAILKALGGSGDINQRTGLRQYHSSGDYNGFNVALHNHPHESGTVNGVEYGGLSPSGDGTEELGYTPTEQEWGLGTLENINPFSAQSIFGGNFLGLGNLWNSYIRNPIAEGHFGEHEGSDPDWEAGQEATSRFQEYLASTKARAGDLKEFLGTAIGGLLGKAGMDFGAQNKAYAGQVGSMNAANVGAGIGPVDPTGEHVANVRQGADTLQRKYEDDRYSLLASTQDAYNQYINNLVSPEFRAQAPSYDEMTANMPWLQDPNAPSNTLVT